MRTLLRIVAGAAALAAAACSSPTRPSPFTPAPTQLPSVAGTWTGFFHITSCTVVTGSQCRPAGYMYPFELTVQSGPDGLTGTFKSETPTSFTAAIRGVPQADGSVAFESPSATTNSTRSTLTLSELTLSPSGASGLSGRLTYTYGETGSSFTVRADILSAAKGGTLPAPTGALGDFAGTWSGPASYDSCTGQCNGLFPRTMTYRLTVRFASTGFEALFDSGLANWPLVRLQGIPQQDGSVLFTGSAEGPSPANSVGRVEVARLQLSLDPNAGLLGTLEGVQRWSNGTVVGQRVSIRGGARQVVDSARPFQGEWRGGYVVRECSGDCKFAPVGRVFNLGMDLSQVGSTLTGRFSEVPLSGSASGRSAGINGELLFPSCPWDWEGITCTQRVRNLTATIDEFGQMHGSFEYFLQANHSGAYEYTVRVDLVDVMQRDR